MKYMGSKSFMLDNGLGKLIRKNIGQCERFVDPFCGSGAVVFFVARKYKKKILASDLQKYSVIISRSVIGRTKEFDLEKLKKVWTEKTKEKIKKSKSYKEAISFESKYNKKLAKNKKNKKKG